MGEAFGAAVTRVNGRAACALFDGAKAPHPARRYPASSRRWKHLFIREEANTGEIDIGADMSGNVGGGGGVEGAGVDSVRESRVSLRDRR